MTNAPAGWYDDGSGRQRWWDGAIWIDRYLPLAGPNVADRAQLETKSVRLDLDRKEGKKEMEKLLRDGWTVAEKTQRGAFQWMPRAWDMVLTRPIPEGKKGRRR